MTPSNLGEPNRPDKSKKEWAALVIPVFNEELRLNLDYFKTILSESDILLVFVDDASTDGTANILREFAEGYSQVKVLRLEKNSGKAAAILHGIQTAASMGLEIIGQADADQSVSIKDVVAGLEICRSNPEVFLVSGARLRLAGASYKREPRRLWIGRLIATMVFLITGSPLYDPQSPAKWWRVPAKKAELLDKGFSTKWFGEAELWLRLSAPSSLKISPLPPGDIGVIEFPLQHWLDVGGSKLQGVRSWFQVIFDLAMLSVVAFKHRRRDFV
jgi:dolichyl-phosphate beta-glucosyltransferase